MPDTKFVNGVELPLTDEEQAELNARRNAPAPVPQVVSDRQFAQALALSGFITEDEAIAWAGAGTIPAALDVIVAQVADPVARFGAKMLLSSATIYERANPLVETVRQAQGLTSEQVDDLFRLAVSL
jgi:hypothetical protein